MARPPLPIGSHGRISRTQLPDGRWKARCRIRDADGVTREMVRYTPEGAKDAKGAAAERALLAALEQRPVVVAESGALSPDSSVEALWVDYLAELTAKGRSVATLDSYGLSGRWIVAAVGGLRLREASTTRLDAMLQTVADKHGVPSAKRTRTVLTGMFKLAVRRGALEVNPVREVGELAEPKRGRAKALTSDGLAQLLEDVRSSDTLCPVVLVESQKKRGMKPTSKPGQVPTVAAFCARSDLADVIALFAATGARIGELMGVRWKDVDLEARTLSITGQVVRERGVGLARQDWAKTPTSIRTVSLPGFAVEMLTRRQERVAGEMVFESSVGTLRDPDTVARQWRQVRAALDLEWVTSHTFRKSVATILDEEGLSARQAADQLGHARVSMTQDVYFGRNRVHSAAADALDKSIGNGVARSPDG